MLMYRNPVFPALIILALLFSSTLAFAQTTEEQKMDAMMQKAAADLGWPETVSTGDAAGGSVGTGKTYMISENGKGDDDDLHGAVTVFTTEPETGVWMTFLTEQTDMEHSSYQGRDGAIQRYGKNCNPKPLVKAINDMVQGWISSVFGESDNPDNGCVTDHGAIAFSCGRYLFTASDGRSDQGGAEDDIAAAIYSAAQEDGLCDYGDTLVIHADTPDIPGSQTVAESTKLGQKLNEYYGVNSYGQQPPFKLSYLDHDGARGADDWFHTTTPMSSYSADNNKFDDYAQAAIKEAFKGADVPQDLYFERVVITYPGESQQKDPSAPFYDGCGWKKDDYYVEVDAAEGKRKIYSKNNIFLSEKRDLGTWAHEFGHSLPSKNMLPQGFDRISDRYNIAGWPTGQYGEINSWGLMGYGVWWGNNADHPVQMEGFTKNAAKWLGLQSASINKTYTLTSIEDMKAGDNVLTLDDPTSADPNDYYIIESRDPSAVFGAPENGVMIYKVSTASPTAYPVMNSLAPQTGAATKTGPYGQQYIPPTLSDTSGNASTYTDVPGQFRIRLLSKSDKSSEVSIEAYNPVDLVGMAIQAAGGGIGPIPASSQGFSAPPIDWTKPQPDLDLHAYDGNGDHVGVNYQTGAYEVNIPGAIASGDLTGGAEWIFVPQGTDVRYEVSSHDTQAYLADNPQYASLATPQNYTAKAVKFDASGNRFEADLGQGSANAGQEVQMKSPTDPSLNYQQKGIPGAGNNKMCSFLPGVFLLIAVGAMLRKR